MLKITGDHNWDFQYLIFSGEKSGWKFIGYIDMPMQKGDPPKFRVVSSNDETWLVVHFLSGSGTGCWNEEEFWYNFKSGNIKEVLRYPVRSYSDVGWAPMVEIK